ncbi:MAG: response regulator [Planctomycetota bacterium]|jgi:signal transduction histidine kinase/ActR/RegA family two-component response regulator|nr:response regulator [Planctomycetota bacterium]
MLQSVFLPPLVFAAGAVAAWLAIRAASAWKKGERPDQARKTDSDRDAILSRNRQLTGLVFDAAASATRTAVWELDRELRVLHASAQAAAVLEMPAEELHGKRIADFLPECAASRISEIVARAVRENQPFRGIFALPVSGGENATILFSGIPVFAADGSPAGVYGVTTDVTEVMDRIFEASKSAVAKASEYAAQAEAANLAKNRFIVKMSHELRSPLNGVMGMLSLLLNTNLSPTQKEYAVTASWSANHLLSTINRVLDYARLANGEEAELAARTFSIWDVVDEVISLYGGDAAAKGVEIAFVPAEDAPDIVSGDAPKLRQALLHLIANAVKFSERGCVLVRTRVESRGDAGLVVEFSVKDDGAGIPGEESDRIFEPFGQADVPENRKLAGAGLGLAIAKGLVELMRGSIGVDSEPGRGSTFRFRIPLAEADAEEASRYARERSAGGDRSLDPERIAEIAGAKILCCVSGEASRTSAARMCRRWGCRIETAADGERARAALRGAAEAREPFALVLADADPGDAAGAESAGAAAAAVPPGTASLDGDAGRQGPNFGRFPRRPILRRELFDLIHEAVAGARENSTPAAPGGERPAHPKLDGRDESRPGGGADPEGSGQPVLLVEDNRVNQIVSMSNLERLGFRVDIAENGKIALEMLAGGKYALVFMDCQMPVMDGYEATLRIRAGEAGKRNDRIPIIAITANNDSEDRERCLAIGMNHYISKPFTLRELRQAVEETCRTA